MPDCGNLSRGPHHRPGRKPARSVNQV